MKHVGIDIVGMLHREGCSCVIFNHGKVTLCHERGVADLYRILHTDPALLSGASVADKVIGKGAAALMVVCGVSSVYADVISLPALELFEATGIPVEYAELVPGIINRSGTGPCPVEALCRDCHTAAECIPEIEKFIREQRRVPS